MDRKRVRSPTPEIVEEEQEVFQEIGDIDEDVALILPQIEAFQDVIIDENIEGNQLLFPQHQDNIQEQQVFEEDLIPDNIGLDLDDEQTLEIIQNIGGNQLLFPEQEELGRPLSPLPIEDNEFEQIWQEFEQDMPQLYVQQMPELSPQPPPLPGPQLGKPGPSSSLRVQPRASSSGAGPSGAGSSRAGHSRAEPSGTGTSGISPSLGVLQIRSNPSLIVFQPRTSSSGARPSGATPSRAGPSGAGPSGVQIQQQFKGIDSIDLNYLGTVHNNRRYQVDRTLATGSYGYILIAKRHPDKTDCAIKMLKPETLQSTQLTIQREVNLVHRLIQNPFINILAFTEILQPTNNRVYIVSELSTVGNLFNYMQRRDPQNQLIWRPMQEQEVRFLMRGITNGVGHLHANNIAHGDINPENVLLFDTPGEQRLNDNIAMSRFIPKLCDFSNSKARAANDPPDQIRAHGRTCAINYAAPESCIATAPIYDMIMADVYSLGCTLISILIGGTPFVPNIVMPGTGQSYETLCTALKTNQGSVKEMIWEYNISNILKDLLLKALIGIPQYRISLKKFRFDRWFNF